MDSNVDALKSPRAEGTLWAPGAMCTGGVGAGPDDIFRERSLVGRGGLAVRMNRVKC